MGVKATRTVKYIRKGDKGEQGAALRGPQAWSDCATGYAFQSGAAGEKFIDVVIYQNNYYVCKASHTKNSSNYPGSSAGNSLWQLGDKIDLVATKILLATYALVHNLGVEAIDMKDSNGNILFQAKDGTVTCRTGIFQNIDVQSGKIAGFQVSGNGLSNTPFDNDAYVIFRNDDYNTFAGIGGNILPASTGARAVARFENCDNTDLWSLGANYAMLLSAKGGRNNRAIQIDGGDISGFAMKNTILSSGTTLSRMDYNVICINTDSEISVYLPSMNLYDDGHVIRFKRLGSKVVKIYTSYSYTWNGTTSRYTMPCIIYDQNNTITGSNYLPIESAGDSFELVWARDLNRTIGSTTYYGCWIQYKLPRDW